MRRIEITDGIDTVILMKDLTFSIQPQRIGTEAIMASGRTVMDIVGYKNILEIPTGWLSPQDLSTLKRMILETGVLTVRYPDVDGDKEDVFLFEMPVFRAFKYDDDGVSQWYQVTILATQQGVE